MGTKRREPSGGGGIISGSRLERGRRLIPAKGSPAGRGCDLLAACCGNLRLAAGGSFGERAVGGRSVGANGINRIFVILGLCVMDRLRVGCLAQDFL
jgi:hypothetical protein